MVTSPSEVAPEIQVLFSEVDFEPTGSHWPCVVISPWEKNWNDFGLKTNCRFRIFGVENAPPLEGRIAFRSMEASSFLHLKRLLDRSLRTKESGEQLFLTQKDVPDFFSMLNSIESYRSLVRAVGMRMAEGGIDRNALEAIKNEISLESYMRISDRLRNTP